MACCHCTTVLSCMFVLSDEFETLSLSLSLCRCLCFFASLRVYQSYSWNTVFLFVYLALFVRLSLSVFETAACGGIWRRGSKTLSLSFSLFPFISLTHSLSHWYACICLFIYTCLGLQLYISRSQFKCRSCCFVASCTWHQLNRSLSSYTAAYVFRWILYAQCTKRPILIIVFIN